LNHFDTWYNCEVTRVKNQKNKKIQKKNQNIKKKHKLTCVVDFNTVWSKLTVRTKLNHF